MTFRTIPLIMCHVCKKVVDVVRHSFNPEHNTHHFVVNCHGKWDRSVLSEDVFTNGWSVTEATAFRQSTGTFTEGTLPVVVTKLPVSEVVDKFDPSTWADKTSCLI